VKRSFVSVPWSRIPENLWLRIVLVDPAEKFIPMNIPGVGYYAVYRAFWKAKDLPKRIFDMVFPYDEFKRALLTVPPELRQGDPVEFEFRKNETGSIDVRNWHLYLEENT